MVVQTSIEYITKNPSIESAIGALLPNVMSCLFHVVQVWRSGVDVSEVFCFVLFNK